jgi:3-isopropylmalate/(R)-2-methylmalate dehydratase small subunit
METVINGKAFVLGDNIDTDQIIPAEHLVYSTTDPEESKLYGKYALSGVPAAESGLPEGKINFISDGNTTSEYKIIIGGSNFGCGSSREHAPYALQKAGINVIIAESYARIFFRNSVDGGFVIPYECTEKLNDKIKTGDQLEINVSDNLLKNLTSGKEYQLRSLGSVYEIVDSGGLFNYARKSGMFL